MAAAPMEARVAVSTMDCLLGERQIDHVELGRAPQTATAWYRLVPSMLTVAPMGSTKLVVRSLTPRLPFAHRIVTGRVGDGRGGGKGCDLGVPHGLQKLARCHALDADGGDDGVDEEDHEGEAEDHHKAVAQQEAEQLLELVGVGAGGFHDLAGHQGEGRRQAWPS